VCGHSKGWLGAQEEWEANQAGKGEESAANTPPAALATTTTTTSSEVEASLREEVEALTKTNADFSKSNVALILSLKKQQDEQRILLQNAETHATAMEQLQAKLDANGTATAELERINAELQVTVHASVLHTDILVLYAAETSCICCRRIFFSYAAFNIPSLRQIIICWLFCSRRRYFIPVLLHLSIC
jgi:hypothetical protein